MILRCYMFGVEVVKAKSSLCERVKLAFDQILVSSHSAWFSSLAYVVYCATLLNILQYSFQFIYVCPLRYISLLILSSLSLSEFILLKFWIVNIILNININRNWSRLLLINLIFVNFILFSIMNFFSVLLCYISSDYVTFQHLSGKC